PLLVLPLAAVGAAYLIGYRKLARRRRAGGTHVVRARVVYFALGYTALVVALLSPLHAVGEELFSVHMVQHLVLTLVAAPLLLLSNSMPVLMWALPPRYRSAVGAMVGRPGMLRSLLRWLTRPLVAGVIFVVTQWAWHEPLAYQWAL